MQFNFLTRITQTIGLVVIILATLSGPVDASSIAHRDIFVGASARAVGMGSAFTAGPSANNGFLWNPSSLGFMNGVEVSMGGMPFPGSTSSNEQAFSIAASPRSFGITERDLGNLSFATWLNGWGNNTTESTQIVLLGYGLAFGQNASAGANLRYYQNNNPIRTNFLWSVDLGMQFAYPLEKWGDTVKVGVNFSELSNGIRKNGVLLENSPLAARFGTTYEFSNHTLFSADFAVRGENNIDWAERLRLHIGAEHWLINGHFGLRVGYTTLTNSDRLLDGELARGVSFRNSAGQLDYAYVSGSDFEDGVHWISATLRWGGGNTEPVLAETPPEAPKTEEVQEEHAPILMPATLTAETTTLELQLSNQVISPNNDGVADETTFSLQLPKTANAQETASDTLKWQLNIRDEYTESVWEKSGTGLPTEGIIWNGSANTGNLVPDGDYEVQLHLLDTQGKSHLKDSKKITVDLIPTTLELFGKTATTVGVKTWDMSPLAHWKLELFDAENTLVEQVDGDGTPPEEITLTKIQSQPAATYIGKLHVQDIAGNRSTQEVQLTLGAEPQIVEPDTTIASDAPAARLTLMVGSFAQSRNAEMLAENLGWMYPDEEVQIYEAVVEGRTMHRVTIGTFSERSEAADLKQHIQETQGVEPILITLQ